MRNSKDAGHYSVQMRTLVQAASKGGRYYQSRPRLGWPHPQSRSRLTLVWACHPLGHLFTAAAALHLSSARPPLHGRLRPPPHLSLTCSRSHPVIPSRTTSASSPLPTRDSQTRLRHRGGKSDGGDGPLSSLHRGLHIWSVPRPSIARSINHGPPGHTTGRHCNISMKLVYTLADLQWNGTLQ